LPILGRILRDRGIVTERQLQEAIQHQVLYGGRLGTSLYELGFITEEKLQEALAKAHGVAAMPVDLREVSPETVALIPRGMAAKHKVFPYQLRGKTLFLMMVDPSDHGAVAKVGFTLGYIVRPLVVPEFRMIQLLRDYYGIDERWRYNDTHRPRALPEDAPDVDTAAVRIDGAVTRDEVVEALLALCRHFFRRVIFFIVREPWVLGWTAAGEGVDRDLAQQLRFPLDEPSVFQTVTRDKTMFIGRLGLEEQNHRFLKALGKRPNTNAAVFPVLVKGRVVNLVYADNGAAGNVKPTLGELLVLLQRVPRAYLRIIRRRVAEARRAVEDTAAEAGEKESE
jgi:Type II secretion system (T2SS), protein E, N-terminal domain